MTTTLTRRGRRQATSWSSDWVVTAPQLKPRTNRRREPWGTVHSRLNGTHRTACGQPCAQWFSLWEMTLDLTAPNMCPGCVDEVSRLARVDLRAD